MTWVPIGCAALALVGLLLSRKRKTRYELKSASSAAAIESDSPRPNGERTGTVNYGSINGEVAPVSSTADINGKDILVHVHANEHKDTGSSRNGTFRRPSFIIGSSPD